MSNLLGPFTIIPSVANNMTGTAAVTSLVIGIREINSLSIQAVWTGTPVGVFSIQGSLNYALDPAGGVANAGTWDDIGVSLTAPAGSASHGLVDLSITGIPFIRIVYTNASGTGTLTATAFGKG